MVGNSSELMPLDSDLFQDLNISVDEHCLRTRYLDEYGTIKFSLSFMKRGLHAYLRIIEPTDNPKHGSLKSSIIIQDVDKRIDNLWTIY